MVNRFFAALAWGYSGAVLSWAALYYFFGDSLWWLALITPFTPLLALLLPVFLLVWLLLPSRKILLVLLLPAFIITRFFLPYFIPPQIPQGMANEASFTILSHNIWKSSSDPLSARVPLLQSQDRKLARSRPGLFSASIAQSVYAMHDGSSGDDQHSAEIPDLVVLQELSSRMANYYVDELGSYYPHYVIDADGDRPRRLGIFSRFPIEPIDVKYLNHEDFRVQLARITTPDHSFLLYNVHPRATDVVRFWREGEPFGKRVRRSFFEREKNFRLLLIDLSLRGEPVVVAGDFNSTTLSDVYKLMTQVLVDSHQEAGWGMGYTFPMHAGDFAGLPIPRRFMRLDMIFYSPDLVALRSEVARFYGESDHLPVIAELTWIAE